MSIQLLVGPSLCGKTFLMREWMLPALLTDPGQVTAMAPPAGYACALIDDPATTMKPQGQYEGPRYLDVSEWRRVERRARVARFAQASLEALCSVAIEKGRMVLCLDEIDRTLGNARAPSKYAAELIERGRHSGVIVVGSCRRYKAVHTSVRANVETAYFGNLADEDDRNDAAAAANVDPELLRHLPEHVFLEWRRAAGTRALIRIENRRKLTLRKL